MDKIGPVDPGLAKRALRLQLACFQHLRDLLKMRGFKPFKICTYEKSGEGSPCI
jgi:hypothetical protein